MADNKMTLDEAINAFDLIATSPQPVEMVEFPKPDPRTGEYIKIGMRPLNHKEMKAALTETAVVVDKFIKDKKVDPNAPEVTVIRHNRHVVEILFRACRNPQDPSKGAFSSPLILEALDDSTLETLFQSYQRVSYQLGERIGEMNNEELNQWIDAIAEGGLADATNFFDRATPLAVIQLLNTMASRLIKLNQDTKPSSLPATEPKSVESTN